MKPNVRVASAVAILLCAGGTFGQDPPAVDDLAARSQRIRLSGGVERSEFEATIRATYRRLTEISDEPIAVELLELRTLNRAELDRYNVLDVSTLPSGELLKVTRQSPNGEPLRIRLSWIEVGEAHTLTPGGQEVMEWSVDEVLRENSKVDPLLERTTFLTTYRVRVEYQGRERLYRAMFLWLDDGEGGFAPAPLDHIVQGLELIIREKIQPDRLSFTPPDGRRRRSATTSLTSCTPGTTEAGRTSPIMRFENGHLPAEIGPSNHGYLFFADYRCTCHSDCSQECDVVDTFQQCNEGGPTTICHKISDPSTAISRGFARPGLPPASCNFGIGCAWRECRFCLCIPGITVGFSSSVGGASATLSPAFVDGTPMLDDLPYYCPPCEGADACQGGSSTAGSVAGALCSGDGGLEDGTSDDGGGFSPPEPVPPSPIVVDLDGGGFAFTAAEDGVRFDMDGDGVKRRLAWTEAGSGDGFIVLDRDASGTIDSGRELFGNHSWQFDSDEPNGFLSLAVFDRPDQRGNDDGWMGLDDGNFRHLRLWIDANHDGLSQPDELSRLAAAGIRAIELDYVESRRRDRHGNELRFASRVVLETSSTRAVDVFLLAASEETGEI